MKHYKSAVIDGKKVLRRFACGCIAAVVGVLAAVNIRIADPEGRLAKNLFDGERIIGESFPGVQGTEKGRFFAQASKSLEKLLTFALSFDPFDGRTAIFGEIPVVRAVSSGYLARTANKSAEVFNPQNADMGQGKPEPEVPSGKEYPIKEVGSGKQKTDGEKISVRNETGFAVNIDEMLKAPLNFDMKGDKPKILIVHTHGTESYTAEGASTYDTSKSDRTLDKEQNVVKIGAEMKKVFEEHGIRAMHDITLHDHPNFNGSYENSRKTVEAYLRKNPEICIVLDVHRDAFVYDDGSKAKFVSEQKGKKTAQLMFVVGTDSGGLEHPQWRENMKLAVKLQNCINKKYPGLMRDINLRKERFNGHLTRGSLIIEVGSSGNSLSEAIEGAKCAALAMSEFFNTMK